MSLVVGEGRFDGPTNMARDLRLLADAEAGSPGARVYGWDRPWVSLGRFQRPDRALVLANPVPWVGRPTGGKGVLHGHDVTVGLAAPYESIGLRHGARSVGPVYRRVVTVLVEALRLCGVPAVLGEESRFCRPSGATGDCFAHVAPNDVVHEATGAKVCGCALKLSERAVLVQASIPVRRPEVDPASVFTNPGPVAWSELEPFDFRSALAEAWAGAATAPTQVP